MAKKYPSCDAEIGNRCSKHGCVHRYEQSRGAKRNGNKECLVACDVPPMLNVTPPASPPLPRVYYCKKCDRYTDIMWALDKGNRPKSKCYKCGEEYLEAVR